MMDNTLNRFNEYKEIVQLFMNEFPNSLVVYSTNKSVFKVDKYEITIERKISRNVDYPLPIIWCIVTKNGKYCLNLDVDIDLMASYLNQETNHSQDYSQYKLRTIFKAWNRYN